MNRTDERRARYRLGHYAEWAAAAALLARGYWILARREKTPLGEIDIIAVRGRRIAFIEVKRRESLEAAEASITPAQRSRTRLAAGLWLARNARYQTHEQGYDVIFVIGRSWPRHLENTL